MGIRPSFGIGIGLHKDHFPVWPEGLREKLIIDPTNEDIDRGWELGDGMSPFVVSNWRKAQKFWSEEEFIFGRVFTWPGDEYSIPNWLVFDASPGRDGYGDLHFYALAALHPQYWQPGFWPLPQVAIEDCSWYVQARIWRFWCNTGKPDVSTPEWKTKRRYIEEMDWAIENEHVYKTMMDDAKWHIDAMKYIFAQEGVALEAKHLRFGLYVNWS